MNEVEGIDVSEYIPDWTGYAKRVGFGMVKATEGLDYENPFFGTNWAGMKAAGIGNRFAYHYAHPDEDPAKQAAAFVNYVRSHGLEEHDHFVLDLENAFGVTPVNVSFWGYVFCEEVNRLAAGHRCLVYSNTAFIEAGYTAKCGSWFLWIADYDVPSPVLGGPWKAWKFWQYAGGTSTDLDRWNGTLAELDEFTSHAGKA